MTRMMQDILKLSVLERILIIEAIWDSIDENENKLELSDDTKVLLDERIEYHKNKPNKGSSWEDVNARIKSNYNV